MYDIFALKFLDAEKFKDFELIKDGVSYKESERREPLPYSAYGIRGFGADVMPVSGYLEPLPSFEANGKKTPHLTQERFDSIAETGINLIIGTHTDYITDQQNAVRLLDMAGNAGITTTVRVKPLINVSEESYIAPAEEIARLLEELLKYPGFAGLYGRDEPHANLFPAVKKTNEVFNKALKILNDKEALSSGEPMLYWNIGGGPYSGDYSGTGNIALTYEEFVDGFIDTDQKYVMFDRYPFIPDNGICGRWFINMSIIRRRADAANIPWWGFTQATGHYNGITLYCRMPTEGEFLWGMNTLLAYGAKGIGHFHLSFPPEWKNQADYSTTGIFDAFGNKNVYWHYVKRGNTNLKAIDHCLMQSRHVGVIQHGKSPAPIPEYDQLGKSWRELVSVTGDPAVIGCFDYKGKTALYVVNNTIEKDGAEIILSFNDKYGYDITKNGKSISVAGTCVPLILDAGEGALVILR